MYAVIRTGGKQYRVEQGQWLDVETLDGEPGGTIVFDDVLLVANGDKVQVGAPTVAGARVQATLVRQGRGPKLVIFKYKRRKNLRRKNGHRQPYTRVRVEAIEVGAARPSAPPPAPGV